MVDGWQLSGVRGQGMSGVCTRNEDAGGVHVVGYTTDVCEWVKPGVFSGNPRVVAGGLPEGTPRGGLFVTRVLPWNG